MTYDYLKIAEDMEYKAVKRVIKNTGIAYCKTTNYHKIWVITTSS